MKIPPFEIDKFIANIASQKNLFATVIYGKDDDVINVRAKKIEKNLLKNLDLTFSKIIIDQNYLKEKSSIIEEFQSISMLAGIRLILVKSKSINQEVFQQLEEISQKDNKENPNFIVIVSDDLPPTSKLRKLADSSKNIASIACYKEKEADILRFIEQQFTQKNIKIDRNIANLILKRVGSGRMKIENELEKIFLYLGGGKNITEDEIIDLVPNMSDDELMDFAQIFADCNVAKTLNMLDGLIKNGINTIFICRVLANYFYKIYKTKIALLQGSNLESEIRKQKIFFIHKARFTQHVNKWGQEGVNKILYDLQALEIRLKKGVQDDKMLFSKFIISVR
jgi:DNA polymerase-3 subunit delta